MARSNASIAPGYMVSLASQPSPYASRAAKDVLGQEKSVAVRQHDDPHHGIRLVTIRSALAHAEGAPAGPVITKDQAGRARATASSRSRR
jgi:hypothetical protein